MELVEEAVAALEAVVLVASLVEVTEVVVAAATAAAVVAMEVVTEVDLPLVLVVKEAMVSVLLGRSSTSS